MNKERCVERRTSLCSFSLSLYMEPRPSLLIRLLIGTEAIGICTARSRKKLCQKLHRQCCYKRRQLFKQVNAIAGSETTPPIPLEQPCRLCTGRLTDQPCVRTNLAHCQHKIGHASLCLPFHTDRNKQILLLKSH